MASGWSDQKGSPFEPAIFLSYQKFLSISIHGKEVIPLKVETTDIYFSAFLMAKGVSLASMSVGNGNKRPKVLFTFSGHGELSRLNREFQQGKALVNLIDLKKTMLHLKDLMYDRIRNNRDERRFNHADHQRSNRCR